jgi:hypothetical protein
MGRASQWSCLQRPIDTDDKMALREHEDEQISERIRLNSSLEDGWMRRVTRIDTISLSIECGPTEYGIARAGRPRGSRGSGPGMSQVAGCAGQRVSVAWCRTEYLVGYLNPSGQRRREGVWLGAVSGGRNGSSHLCHDPARYKYPRGRGGFVMFTNANANTATASVAPPGFARRSLLGMVVIAAAPLSRRALAETARADATSTPSASTGHCSPQ